MAEEDRDSRWPFNICPFGHLKAAVVVALPSIAATTARCAYKLAKLAKTTTMAARHIHIK